MAAICVERRGHAIEVPEEGGIKGGRKRKRRRGKGVGGRKREGKGMLRVLRAWVEGVDGNESALCNEALRAAHLRAV